MHNFGHLIYDRNTILLFILTRLRVQISDCKIGNIEGRETVIIKHERYRSVYQRKFQMYDSSLSRSCVTK